MRDYQFLITNIAILAIFGWGVAVGKYTTAKSNQPPCPETLPTQVTDMFTIKGDTLVIKQGVDFVISTRAVNLDTAGIMHRKTLHNSK